jgi:hypothetical protein
LISHLIIYKEEDMALSEKEVKKMIELSGYKPTAEQVEATTRLHETLTEQLGKLPDGLLEGVEPHFIQPTRK